MGSPQSRRAEPLVKSLTDAGSMEEEEEEVRRSLAIEEEVRADASHGGRGGAPAMEEEEVHRPWRRRRRCAGHGGVSRSARGCRRANGIEPSESLFSPHNQC
jgi:hypothetical protein